MIIFQHIYFSRKNNLPNNLKRNAGMAIIPMLNH